MANEEIIGKPLVDYIQAKHTQEECIGFIDGYEARKAEGFTYTEEEVKEYAEKFAHFIQQEKRPEGILTGWHEWFKLNKKK